MKRSPRSRNIASGRPNVISVFAKIGGATFFSQLAIFASSPILTRLYTKDDFGTFGVFLAIATLGAAIAPLGYSEGILAPTKRRQSDALFAASLYASVVFGAFSAVVLLIALGLHPSGNKALPDWAGPLFVPTIIGMAVTYCVQIFAAREANWRAVQQLILVQASIRVVSQLSFAFAGLGALGLICAEAIMRCFTSVFGLWKIRLTLKERVRSIPLRDVAAEARRYWRFPAMRMPSSLLNNAATLAPTPMIAALFGLGPAGLWVLIDQVINAPLGFVNKTVGDVFAGYFTNAFHNDPSEAKRIFWIATWALIPLGLLPCALLWFFGPPLFATVFGEPWRPAGELAGLMAFVLLARFVVQPLSWACNTVNRPEAKLIFDLLQLALIIGTFLYVEANNLKFEEFILLISISYTSSYIALFGLTVWAIYFPRKITAD